MSKFAIYTGTGLLLQLMGKEDLLKVYHHTTGWIRPPSNVQFFFDHVDKEGLYEPLSEEEVCLLLFSTDAVGFQRWHLTRASRVVVDGKVAKNRHGPKEIDWAQTSLWKNPP